MLEKKNLRIAYLCYYPNHYVVFRKIKAKLPNLDIDIVVRKTGAEDDFQNMRLVIDYLNKSNITFTTHPTKKYDVIISCTTVSWYSIRDIRHCGTRFIRILYSTVGKNYTYSKKNRLYDLILTIGPYSQKKLERFSKCISVGMPKLDDLFSGKYVKKDVLSSIGLNSHKITLLYLPTWENFCSIDKFGSAISKLSSKYNVIVKPHNHTIIYEKKKLEVFRSTSVFLFTEDREIDDLISVSDLVISDYSGAIFEAAAADKPVVLLDIEPEILKNNRYYNPNDLEHNARDIGIRVGDPKNLESAVKKALKDDNQWFKKREHYTKLLFSHIDDHSSQRAAKVIGEYIDDLSKLNFIERSFRWKCISNYLSYIPYISRRILARLSK